MRFYITYLSNDRDVKGVVLLSYMLKKLKSKYSLQCICLENVSSKTKSLLLKNGVKTVVVNLENILLNHGLNSNIVKNLVIKNYFGKFIIFLLQTDDVCVYLDSDLLIEKNIDHLFDNSIVSDKYNILMARDMLFDKATNKFILQKKRFNSGVIVFRPNIEHFVEFIKIVNSFPNTHTDKGVDNFNRIIKTDQEILNNIITLNIHELDHKFNALPYTIELFTKKGILNEPPHVIHYIHTPKPWNYIELSVDKHIMVYQNKTQLLYYEKWLDLYNEYIKEEYKINLNYIHTAPIKIDEDTNVDIM